MKGEVYIGAKFLKYYYEITGRKHGFITTEERIKARLKHKKK